jgi:hypothetical protein
MATQDTSKTGFPVIDPAGPVARKLSLEERYATLATLYKFQYFATYRHIAEHAGWEVANDIADGMAAEAIPHIAAGYKRKFDLPGDGAALVAQVHATEMIVEGADVETISETEDAAEYKVLCPWGQAIQSGKFDDTAPIYDGLCRRGCWQFMQRVGETVRDDLHVEREAWMGDGAPRCHFTIAALTDR